MLAQRTRELNMGQQPVPPRNPEAEVLQKRINFLQELMKASYVTPEKRKEYQESLAKCLAKLQSLSGGAR